MTSTAGVVTLVTVPSDRVGLIRSVYAYNHAGTTQGAYLSTGVGSRLHLFANVPDQTTADWEPWLVIEPGELLQVRIFAQPWDFVVSGQLLTVV